VDRPEPLGEILSVEPEYFSQVPVKRGGAARGQNRDAIPAALGVADGEFQPFEVNILHAQPQAFEEAQA